MSWQQPDLLSLVALGTTGGQPLADGSTLAAGIHLRWAMGKSLGFPVGGFDVYRRQHSPGTQVCVSFVGWSAVARHFTVSDFTFTATRSVTLATGCSGSAALYLAGSQSLHVEPPWPAREVYLEFDGSLTVAPKGIAYWESDNGSVIVAQGVAQLDSSTGTYKLTLYADRIDRVRVTGTDMLVCSVCAAPMVDASIAVGWGTPLNGALPIYLPITNPVWPPRHTRAPDDQAEAEWRLSITGLSATARARYADGFRNDLHGILYSLVGTRHQALYSVRERGTPVTAPARPAPSGISWPGLGLLSLISLDPNLARILGLYFQDSAPAVTAPGSLWDYRVVGHWGAERYPATHVTFDALRQDRRYTRILSFSGIRVVSPRPVQVVTESWFGAPRAALQVAQHPTLTSPVWITIAHKPVSVTVALKTSAGASLTPYSGTSAGTAVAVAAGEQEVVFEDAAGIDTVRIWSASDLYFFDVMLRSGIGPLGDVNYVTFRQSVGTPVPVSVPTLQTPVALPGRARLESDGSVTDAQNMVGLRWSRASAGAIYLRPGAAILHHLQRDARGSGATASSPTAASVLNRTRPTLIGDLTVPSGVPRITTGANGSVGASQRPAGWSTDQYYYIDSNLADGWYGYRVRGIDLFGRAGRWSTARTVQVLDSIAPPPPVAVQATYLDADDQWLSSDDHDWAVANGYGIKVMWEWPGFARIQAPDVVAGSAEFRVYLTEGPLNTLRGEITAVTDAGTMSTLQTDQEWTGSADGLKDVWVRVNGSFFRITGNGTGTNFTLTVENLTNPSQSPEDGPFTLTYARDGEGWTDYREPTSWDERVHVEPAVDIDTVKGSIVAVTAIPDDFLLVTTDQSLTDTANVLTPGVLVTAGVVYQADGHQTGMPMRVVVKPREMMSTTARPRVGDSFVYYPGRTYTAYIARALTPAAGERRALAHIAVSTSDGKSHASDDALWSDGAHGSLGGRAGNEGPVSPACKVTGLQRSAPNAPTANVVGTELVYAEPADYYGDAKYELTWSAVSGVAGYIVYRASGASLFDRDRAQRRAGNSPYDSDPFYDVADFDSWLASEYPSLTREVLLTSDLSTLTAATRASVTAAWRAFYARFSESDIQTLASHDCNQAVYRRVNAELLEDTSYADTLDGSGTGFFVYRIAAQDSAGNESDWSDAFPPVHIHDVTPPATPVITSILGGENSVTIAWRANTEADLAEYRLWRATAAHQLDDVRHLDITATITPGGGPVETYVDSGLTGPTMYYYRLAAVDTNGNVSEACTVKSAQAYDLTPPAPPSWESAAWKDTDTDSPYIALAWSFADTPLPTLVQRKVWGKETWRSVSGWLSSEVASWNDTTASTQSVYRYRLTVQGSNGVTNDEYVECEIRPPTT